MSYFRVIPRDLFNEAKLLKCLGQLALAIHNGVRWPLRLEHESAESGFQIEQDTTDGGLFCSNLILYCGTQFIELHTPLNSKSAYPLQFDGVEPVFDRDGGFSDEFVRFLDGWAEAERYR